MGRTIGIRHRVKKTAEGESHPTQVAIKEGKKVRLLDLPDEDAELQFVLGDYKGEGVREGDNLAMVLGGSGDYLAFALSRRAGEIGASIMRVPSFVLKNNRTTDSKDDDSSELVRLAETSPNLFYPVTVRDLSLVKVRVAYSARIDAMKARIACEQRLRQRTIGSIFCSPDGLVPEGGVEKAFEAKKANDAILQALLSEEKARERELASAVESLDVFERVFSPVEGCGVKIAARMIAAIIDIRRFATEPGFKKFCGVHVLSDGRFARRRSGEVANWQPDCRQALYLLGEQFNRRPDSVWGKKLREYKAKLRVAHPDVVVVEGKKRYTDGHIHKMAIWRTVTKFAEYVYMTWWDLEREVERQKKVA
ncbi:MAG: hypothetical protein NUW02_03395 [Candidatus Campbellbacteria bacterium]|nr:hypothetical protein [Candidatus Campbellbacteria bacterium]